MARLAGNVAASRFADRYGLALPFALAYLISWSVWRLEGRVENGGLVIWLGSAGPALAAVLVAALSRGRQGLEDLLSRLVVWRVGVKWYLIALFLVPAAGLGIAGGYALTGNLTAHLPGAEAWRDTLGLQLVGIGSAVALGTLISAGEELGWRGFALPRFQERVHPLASSAIIGFLLVVWHFNGFLGGQAEAVSLQDALFFLLGTVSASVIYTWLFNSTRGSVLIACLFHAVYDVTVMWVLAVLPLPTSATRRINPSLDVQDLPASVRYYVEVLGFAGYVETPALGIVESDGHQIHLRNGGRDSSPTRVWIGVEDVAVLYEQYTARKVKLAQEPTNYTWAYQMIVEDLDRNLLVFGSAPLDDEPFHDQNAWGTGVP